MWWQEHEVEVATPHTVRKQSEINIALFKSVQYANSRSDAACIQSGSFQCKEANKDNSSQTCSGFCLLGNSKSHQADNQYYHMESSSKKHALQLIIMGKAQRVLELFTGKWEASG